MDMYFLTNKQKLIFPYPAMFCASCMIDPATISSLESGHFLIMFLLAVIFLLLFNIKIFPNSQINFGGGRIFIFSMFNKHLFFWP